MYMVSCSAIANLCPYPQLGNSGEYAGDQSINLVQNWVDKSGAARILNGFDGYRCFASLSRTLKFGSLSF